MVKATKITWRTSKVLIKLLTIQLQQIWLHMEYASMWHPYRRNCRVKIYIHSIFVLNSKIPDNWNYDKQCAIQNVFARTASPAMLFITSKMRLTTMTTMAEVIKKRNPFPFISCTDSLTFIILWIRFKFAFRFLHIFFNARQHKKPNANEKY